MDLDVSFVAKLRELSVELGPVVTHREIGRDPAPLDDGVNGGANFRRGCASKLLQPHLATEHVDTNKNVREAMGGEARQVQQVD